MPSTPEMDLTAIEAKIAQLRAASEDARDQRTRLRQYQHDVHNTELRVDCLRDELHALVDRLADPPTAIVKSEPRAGMLNDN